MREIKFRAWDEQRKKMGQVGAMDWEHDFSSIISAHLRFHDGHIQKVYPNDMGDTITFMQFTGLKDKNGKEIYEGDIVEVIGNIYENPELLTN